MTQYEKETLTNLYQVLDYAQCNDKLEAVAAINEMIVEIEAKAAKRFEIGQTSVDKYGVTWQVFHRTEKTVTLYDEAAGKSKRCKICLSGRDEYAKPYGSYSQAPCVFGQ